MDKWTVTSSYNIAKDAPAITLSLKEGKHTLGASYAVKDEAATLTWACKPFKVRTACSFLHRVFKRRLKLGAGEGVLGWLRATLQLGLRNYVYKYV
jgi:hypothetical protein